jgi:hypothetical protein
MTSSVPPPPPLPPLPDPQSGASSRVLANLTWITLLVSVVFQSLVAAAHWVPHTRLELLTSGLIKFSLAVGGMGCGVIALSRVRKYGRAGIFGPALAGLIAWVVVSALAVLILGTMRYRADVQRESVKAKFAPMAHLPHGVRVEDAEWGYSFELPPEFQKLPAEKMPGGNYRLAYMKQNGDQPAEVVIVEGLGGTILPDQHITAKDLPDKSYTLTPFIWRGLAVDGVRIPETMGAGEYVTYKAQIPIKKQSIQIGFGGPATEEAHIKAFAEQVLSTLDGPVNW